MPRKLIDTNNVDEVVSLDTLIPMYATNKSELDSYKKLCDLQNTQIKELMVNEDLTEKTVGDWTAKYSVTTRESFNEDKLLQVCQIAGIKEVIKTKEYIDMEALESAIYNGKISEELLLEIDKCREVKEVPTLMISKKKVKRGINYEGKESGKKNTHKKVR